MLTLLQDKFLFLIRLGLAHTINSELLQDKSYDWDAIIALAERHGLSGVLSDGIEHLSQDILPPKPMAIQLIGNVLKNYEYRYERYRRAIAELAGFYNEHGFKMMVLKGYACSLDWLKPEHRPSGDIDIWQFGYYKKADALLVSEKGIEIDYSHHHHTVFYWREFMVENHYDFINVHARKSNKKLEKIFKELGRDDTHYSEIYGERVYMPSPDLHALFLIRHSVAHFAAAEITLRHVLDWAFFVQKHGSEVDWKWLLEMLEEFGHKRFFDVLNGICVEDLGFQPELFPNFQIDPSIKERVLCDILEPEFSEELPSRLLPRVWFRFRRWNANAWKQELCYRENRWSVFWTGVWNHLLKPSSI